MSLSGNPLSSSGFDRRQRARDSLAKLREQAEAGELPDLPATVPPPPPPAEPLRPPTLRALGPNDNAYISDVGILTPAQALQFPPEAQRNMTPTHADTAPPAPRSWYERWGDDIADSAVGADINRLTDDVSRRGGGNFVSDLAGLAKDSGSAVASGAKQVAESAADAVSPDWAKELGDFLQGLIHYAPYLIGIAAAGGVVYFAAPVVREIRTTSSGRRRRTSRPE